jgi:Transposase DDE domain
LISLWIFIAIHPKLLLRVLFWKQRKEAPMDHGQRSMVADKLPWVFSEALLTACGKDVKFCRRERTMTPLRLGLALTATCASQRVETIADVHCGFHALFGTTVPYKAFYTQVAKPRFADCARTMTERLVGDMTLKGLGFAKGPVGAELRPMVRQDGSAFASHDGVREVFPGRFKVVKPAAVELQTTMDLRCDAPTPGGVAPDTTSEQAFGPEPTSRRDSVLWAERGYSDLHCLQRLQEAGGFVLIRAKAGMNPQVLEAFREAGKRLRSLRNTPLQTIHAKLPKRLRVELRVQWHVAGGLLWLRRGIRGHRRTKSFCSWLTNLPSQRYPLDTICRASPWRGQVEVLLKEGKSYAHLPAFDTANPALVEGVMWTALAAAALKRFLAQMTHLLIEVPMSTRKGARGALHVVGAVVEALKSGDVAGL